MTVRKTRSQLYRAARILGDVEAAEKGPSSYVKRRVRRKVYARSGSLTHRILRGLGLSR